MKICIVSDYLPEIHPGWSGAELVAAKTGEMLARRGHEIIHIALKCQTAKNRKNVYFVGSPFRKFGFIVKNFPVDIFAYLRIVSLLSRLRPDVVHIQAKFLFLASAKASLALKIPYLYTFLDYYPLCPRNLLLRPNGELCDLNHGAQCVGCVVQSERGGLKKINKLLPSFLKKSIFNFRRKRIDFFMMKAAKIITFSQTSRQRLLRYGYKDNQVEVLYHYEFEKPVFKMDQDIKEKNEKIILFVGTLTHHKGLHVVVKALVDITKEIPQARLLVVGRGKGEYVSEINRLIDQLKLKDHLAFLGHRSNKEIFQLISNCDVVVVPEQWYSEFGPVVLIESKLLKKPVVASKIGSIPEYIRNGEDGVLVGHDSWKELSKAAIRLLSDPQLARTMGKSISDAVKRVQDSEKTMRLYEELCLTLVGK